jgi:FSR family fosmidomycin resistance protein-like MFS transporter
MGMVRLKNLLGLNSDNFTLWGISLGHAFLHWFPSTFYLLLPLIKDELGLSYTEMGFLVTARFLASTVANFPSGMIVDLIERHYLVVTIALAWVGVPYLFIGMSQSYAVLLGCMAMIGIGNNLWHPAAFSILRDAYPQKRGWAMGWHSSGANIGDALGPFMSGIFLAWVTWRTILVGSFIPGLGIGFLIWWLLKKPRSDSPRLLQAERRGSQPAGNSGLSLGEYWKGLGSLLINPSIFILSFINGVRSLTQNGLSTFLPSFFMDLLKLSPWMSGVYMTIIQLAGIIASPISGRLSDEYGRKRVVTGALFSTSAAIFFLAFFNVPWLFVVFLSVVGFFLYSLRPVLIAWTMEVAPKELGGSAVGLQFTFQSVLSALAPVLGGWIADTWGLMVTFYFLAAVLLLSNLLVVFLREPVWLKAAQE